MHTANNPQVRLTLPRERAAKMPILEDPHLHYLDNPELQDVRRALRPSPLFEAEVDRIVAEIRAQYNTSGFSSVHVRVEDDWRKWVALAEPWIPGRAVWVGEDAVAESLLHQHGLPPGSLLLVCSGTPVGQLQRLCGPDGPYRCVDFGAVWRDRAPEVTADTGRESMAFLSFWVAARGDAFFGTVASSYSVEMHETFRLAGKPAHFYNPPCEGGPDQACRGDVPPPPPPPPEPPAEGEQGLLQQQQELPPVAAR